jgi:hypothetical protein
MRHLYQRKVAETGKTKEDAVIAEMVTQAALNYWLAPRSEEGVRLSV